MGRLQRAATFIESLAEHLGMLEPVKMEMMKNRWHELIGPPISLNTQPAFFKNAELTINVSSNVWMSELRFHKDAIVSKLQEFGVSRIKLRQGTVKWSNEPLQNDQNASAALTVGETAYVESLSAGIKDAELKEILTRTALKVFTRMKTMKQW